MRRVDKSKTTAIALRRGLEKYAPIGTRRDLLKLIAMDVGKEVATYIEVMYPEAVNAASSTFLLSVRNHTHNEIMALADFEGGVVEMLTKITERNAFRRRWKAAYQKIRNKKEETAK